MKAKKPKYESPYQKGVRLGTLPATVVKCEHCDGTGIVGGIAVCIGCEGMGGVLKDEK